MRMSSAARRHLVPLRLLRLLTFVLLLQLSHGFDAFGAGAGGGRQPDTEFYDTLDLAPDCSPADIKKAYRKQALKNHPDKGGDPEKFKKINEAYAVLSDEQKRAAYDRMGKAAVDGSMPGGMGGGMGGFPGGMGGGFPGGFAFGGGMGGMSTEDIFAQVFGQAMGGGGRAGGFGAGFGQPRMRDQEMTMPVTLEELYLGGTKRVAIRRPYISNGAIREERAVLELCERVGANDSAVVSVREPQDTEASAAMHTLGALGVRLVADTPLVPPPKEALEGWEPGSASYTNLAVEI